MTGSRGCITYNIKVVTIVQSQPAAIIVLATAYETAKIKTKTGLRHPGHKSILATIEGLIRTNVHREIGAIIRSAHQAGPTRGIYCNRAGQIRTLPAQEATVNQGVAFGV